MNAPGQIPSQADMLQRVAGIAPLLSKTAPDSEQQRTLCADAVSALHREGLFRLWTPREVGGYDLDLDTHVMVMLAVAHADMSACWTMMIGNTVTGVMASCLSDTGLGEVFVGADMPIAAGSLKPDGRAAPVAGGYRVSGKWGFGSGIHHAGWISAHCICAPDAEDPFPLTLAIPVSEVHIHDDWHVAGLCGSGSSTYEVRDVFVPHSRAFERTPRRGSPRTGNPGPRIPLEHASVSLGGARRALDEAAATARSKRRLLETRSVGEKQAVQLELGKLDAEWQSLLAGVRDGARRLDADYDSPDIAVALRAVCALATERSAVIGERCLRIAGAGAVLTSHVLQRTFRDLTVSAQHYMISDGAYETLGKLRLSGKDGGTRFKP
tara:strand:- start:2260 stop:3402 length:1143 start_codon:yes stop_codon:yes gene_type:complete